ncbi:MAG: bmrU [Acidobacteria bacterium]|nr:bmrU [Acidobacteriota bacterium]
MVVRPPSRGRGLKALFIVNARSGARRGYDVEALIREHCSFDFTILPCSRIADLDPMIGRAARGGFEAVYAVGGDGTVHEIAKRLIGTRLALGILPTGSGNGFARHLGLPVEPLASLASCRDGVVVAIDTAEINDTRFIGVMGVGFDAFIADRFASSTVRGLKTYIQLGLRGFISYAAEEYELEIDGKAMTRKAFVLAVANASQYGNNARIAPLASVRDGLLDLVLVDRIPLLNAPWMLMRLFNGTMHQARGVTVLRGKSITIRRTAAGPAHLDGEPMLMPAELRIRVNPRSLNVLVPGAWAARI